MFAEIITIGDEILIGQIVDTNSTFIAKELNKIGISVFQITSIQDDKEHILAALDDAKKRAQVVILTGGLGPTKDDITKHTLCTYFNDTLVENTLVLEHVTMLFKKYIGKPITEVNKKQALVPSRAEVLHNANGTAPGMWIKDDETVFVSLPGVPFEMKNLIKNAVIPKIAKTFKRPYILHRTIITYGMGESALAEKIAAWEDGLPEFIKLAYLPNLGKVRLRLSAKGENKEMIANAVAAETTKLYALIGDIIFGEEGEDTVEAEVAKLLTAKNMTLATAESFTGGRLAEKITAIPGASAYFKGTIVSYATTVKEEVLQVPQKVIEEHSVVSEEVAKLMASNVRGLLKSDFAIATTGNAGPTKGDSDVEVGTVFVGIATPTDVFALKYAMGNSRERITQKTVNKAFELIRKEILKF